MLEETRDPEIYKERHPGGKKGRNEQEEQKVRGLISGGYHCKKQV